MMTRNLLYFICPLVEGTWKWNVRRLLDHWTTFNGKKLIIVAVDETTDSADTVKKAFEGYEASFEVVQNDPEKQESGYFIRFLSAFGSTRSDECTFHAHAKGQSHEGKKLENVFRWAEAMYVLNLERPDLIDVLLRTYMTVGCYKQTMPHGGSFWHFAGGFFWMRHDGVFTRDWAAPLLGKYGVEGYPGRLFAEDEAFELTPFWHPQFLYEKAPGEETYREWLKGLVSNHLEPKT